MIAAEDRSSDAGLSPVLVFCSCGVQITRAEWSALALVGVMASDVETHDLELRNCERCLSTLSVYVPKGLP